MNYLHYRIYFSRGFEVSFMSPSAVFSWLVAPPTSESVHLAALHVAKRASLVLFATAAVTFFMFQKKMLSKPVSKIVSAIFFAPTFPITVLMRLGNYWTPIDDTVILGCAPMGFLGHPQQLHKLGVRGVVNMCTEYSGPTSYYADIGIKQLRLPTVDHFEPSLDQMNEAVKFIEQHKALGNKVYVHCKAGHGRAASIALCWLMKQNPTISSKVYSEMRVLVSPAHR